MKKILITILLCIITCLSWGQDKLTDAVVNSFTLEFVVNTDTIIQNGNYFNFINNIVPFIKNNYDHIESIIFVGSASPEGNKSHNIYLANKRAAKIASFISSYVQKDKFIVNNDYSLFLQKTGLDESDYQKLRATYVEIKLKKEIEQKVKIDSVYVENTVEKIVEKLDTVYINRIDTLYANKEKKQDKLVLSLYNNLVEDLLIRPNIGIELYFNKFSFFVEGSFSDGKLFGKNYDIDFWHTGFRKYFNTNYNKWFIEIYGRTGYFDTELLSKDDNGLFGICFGGGIGFGYKFSVCTHWKITPMIRFGYDDFKFKDYYSSNCGNIDVLFGKYVDGRIQNQLINNTEEGINNGNILYLNDKIINKNFINDSYNMQWFGPTFIGITIQRDFYIHKKKTINY